MPKATKFHQGGIEFQKINDHLLNVGAVHSASELQGYLCGLLCGGKKLGGSAWVDQAWEFLDLEAIGIDLEPEADNNNEDSSLDAGSDSNADTSSDASTPNLLKDLYKITSVQLADDNYSFSPLLPEDSASLVRRTEELGAWCQGFLHGVGASGIQGDKALSPEASEAIRDLAEISQVDADVEEGTEQQSEENEGHFVELVEYVRAAVLTFRSDTLPANTAAKMSARGAAKAGNVVEGDFGGGNGTIH